MVWNYPSHKPEYFFDSTDFKNLPLSEKFYKKTWRIMEPCGLEKASRSSSPNVGLAQIFSLFSSKCGVQSFRCAGFSRRTSPGHVSMHWQGKISIFHPKTTSELREAQGRSPTWHRQHTNAESGRSERENRGHWARGKGSVRDRMQKYRWSRVKNTQRTDKSWRLLRERSRNAQAEVGNL